MMLKHLISFSLLATVLFAPAANAATITAQVPTAKVTGTALKVSNATTGLTIGVSGVVGGNLLEKKLQESKPKKP